MLRPGQQLWPPRPVRLPGTQRLPRRDARQTQREPCPRVPSARCWLLPPHDRMPATPLARQGREPHQVAAPPRPAAGFRAPIAAAWPAAAAMAAMLRPAARGGAPTAPPGWPGPCEPRGATPKPPALAPLSSAPPAVAGCRGAAGSLAGSLPGHAGPDAGQVPRGTAQGGAAPTCPPGAALDCTGATRSGATRRSFLTPVAVSDASAPGPSALAAAGCQAGWEAGTAAGATRSGAMRRGFLASAAPRGASVRTASAAAVAACDAAARGS